MKVLVINSSMSEGSNTKNLLLKISDDLLTRGVNNEFISLREYELEIFTPDSITKSISSSILFDKIKSSDIIIFGSPEYHGTYSGSWKNLIDHLEFKDLYRKIIGLVVTTGSLKSGLTTINSMRLVLRTFHCYVINSQIAFSETELVKGDISKKINEFNQDLIHEWTFRCKVEAADG